ncbi:MAG: hypothetical protein ACYS0E_19085 [Planctomycetota bacterium]
MGLVIMILLATLATIFPASMGPKADPLVTPEVIKPEWFFYVAFRWLKLFPGTIAILRSYSSCSSGPSSTASSVVASRGPNSASGWESSAR